MRVRSEYEGARIRPSRCVVPRAQARASFICNHNAILWDFNPHSMGEYCIYMWLKKQSIRMAVEFKLQAMKLEMWCEKAGYLKYFVTRQMVLLFDFRV